MPSLRATSTAAPRRSRAWRASLAAALLLATTSPALRAQPVPTTPAHQAEPEAATGATAQALVTARRHMVVAAHPLAAAAGREMLRTGGSAIDAAIATLLVLGLVEPQSSGLGGGALLLHWDVRVRRLTSLDGRETAPAAARPDRFSRGGRPMPFDMAVRSGLSVGVPGLVHLMEEAHRRHGRLSWPVLFEPAVRIAQQGFAVSPRLAALLMAETPERFSPAARRHFFPDGRKPLAAGHLLRNPDYALTLRSLARDGAAAFHTGPIAEAIVAAVTTADQGPGDLTAADLAGYRTIERQPVCAPYRGHAVCGFGPPSSGGIAVGQALMLVEGFDLGRGSEAAMNAPALHLIGEALKLAFADRNWWVADPDYVAVPAGLLDPDYLSERRLLVSATSAIGRPYPGLPPGRRAALDVGDGQAEAAGTTHVSIVDGDGNAVSVTATIEGAFGSRLWAAGFLLNNQLTDFSPRPRDGEGRPVANRVEAGKRPRSSMSPTIVLDQTGEPVIVTGSPGGSRIIPYVVKTLVAMIDWELDAARAAALPNLAADGRRLVLEAPGATLRDMVSRPRAWLATLGSMVRLKALGQDVRLEPMTSGVHTVRRRPDRMLDGGADPRREGRAMGD